MGSFTPDYPQIGEPVIIDGAELEVMRLIDLEGLSQEEAGARMGVSRGTIWRLLQEARRKTTAALFVRIGSRRSGLAEFIDH